MQRRGLKAIGSALQIRPGEGRKTSLLFVHLLIASAIFILGRTVRDTLFLSRFDVSMLPWMFVFYGIASALTVVVYAQVADKLRRSRLIVVSCAIGAVTYFGTWLAVRAELRWIYPVFYVWSEVAANLFIVQFWTLANDVNDSRAARRLFPAVGAARVLGVVLIGLATSVIVAAIGTAQLLLVLIALMAMIVVVALALAREEPTRPTPLRTRKARRAQPKVMRDPYVRALSLFLLFAFVALTLGDYQFKIIARETFQEDALARYFSLFYAGTGIVSFLFQIFVTPRLLRKMGVGWGMGLMPGVFGAASAVLFFVPVLPVATIMKFADNGFQYTIHDTTLQALYVPFPEQVKARTRALLDAVVKPLSYGVGGLALVFLAPLLEVHVLSAVVVGLVVLWLGVIPIVRRRYVRALQSSLDRSGALSLESMSPIDSDARRLLGGLLEEGTPRLAVAALEHLEGALPVELLGAVEKLALHEDPTIRRAALNALGRSEGVDPAPILRGSRSSSPSVRTAATEALGPVLGDGAVDRLGELLDDSAQDVRVGALEGLLRYGGVEGGIVGGERLAAMLANGRETKIEAARVLRRLGRAAYRPVRALLDDPDPDVRAAALRAATKIGDARLIPISIEALRDKRTRHRAHAALIAIGEPAVDALGSELRDSPREVQLHVPRILRRIAVRASYDALREHMQIPDGHVRLRVLSGLASLRHRLALPALEVSELEALIRWELRRGYGHLAAWAELRESHETPLLEEQTRFRLGRFDKRVLRLLSLRYDKPSFDLIRKALPHPTRRSNALELLDGLLDPALRTLVMPWFDDAPIAERLARAGDLAPASVDAETYLLTQCNNPNPFIAALAFDALSRAPSSAIQRAADILDPESRKMHTTLEKVLLLKSSKIFSRVAAEDLAPMAVAAEEQRVAPGETVLREGEVGDVLYVVVSGSVRVSRSGTELATLGAGEAFGEMAVMDAEPRSATVTAEEETELLAIGSEEFYDVLYEQMEIAEGVIRMLTTRLREADRAVDPVSMIPPPS